MKEHIIINKDRTVVVPDSVRKIGIQYDHRVNTLTFDCPRYADDNQSIDLSRMAIYINFSRNDKTKGSIAATNVFVDPDDPEIMHFDFIITRSVTLVNGPIICLVCAKSTDAEGVEDNHWNSDLFNKLSVGEGMEAEEELTEEEIDYITGLLQEINTTHAEVADIDTRVEDLEFNQEKQGVVSEVNLEAMTWTEGSYITGSGTIGSSSGYGISELVTLPKMSTLILDATGYQSDVAMVAKSDHTPLVTSVDSKTHYEYYTDEEIQVYISCKTTAAKSAKIVRNVAETLSDLERENSELKGDLSNETIRAINRENEIESLFTMPTQEAVNNWLNEHPEATTTVQDNSLEVSKLTDNAKLFLYKDYVTPQMFGAVGDGITDDSDSFQAMFNSVKNEKASIIIPPKTYALGKTIIIDKQQNNVIINAYGAKLVAIGDSWNKTNYMFELGRRDTSFNYYSQYLYINGINIDCKNKCSAIRIKEINHWVLRDFAILDCYIGVKLEDTYYGAMCGESSIRNTSCGIMFDSNEVNTIELNQISINNGNKTFGNSKSYGILLSCPNMGAIKFNGLVIEAFDYAIYKINQYRQTQGVTDGVFKIDTCYFEANHIGMIDFSDYNEDLEFVPNSNGYTARYISNYRVTITNCRTHGVRSAILGTGEFNFKNNQPIDIISSGKRHGRLLITGDIVTGDWPNRAYTDSGQFGMYNKVNTSITSKAIHKYNGNNYPEHNVSTLLSATEDTFISCGNGKGIIKNHNVFELNPRPIILCTENSIYRPVGYVMPDIGDNSNKMLQIKNGNIIVRDYNINGYNNRLDYVRPYEVMNNPNSFEDGFEFIIKQQVNGALATKWKKYKDAIVYDPNNEATDENYLDYKRAFKIEEIINKSDFVPYTIYYIYEIDAYVYMTSSGIVWLYDYYGLNGKSYSVPLIKTLSYIENPSIEYENGAGLEVYVHYCTDNNKWYYRYKEDNAYQEMNAFNL